MDFNRQRVLVLVLAFNFVIVFGVVPFYVGSTAESESSPNVETQADPKGQDIPSVAGLPDNVYTFNQPSDTFTHDYDLDEDYLYYIYIELVTPHNVTKMRIRIWDPDDQQYNIFESEMFFYPEYGRYFEIPFGTSRSGDHTFEFYSVSNVNFNLHIQITQGPKCLYDKIDAQKTDNAIFYEVRDFTNGESINEDDLDLKANIMYEFYIGRVSAISIMESNEIHMDCTVEDPDGTTFEIYNYQEMQELDGLDMFVFGTAIKGEYNFDLTIYCNVEYVNIAYLVVEDYQIAEGLEGDEEEEGKITLQDIAEDINESSKHLPGEWIMGTMIFISAISLFAIILLINQKKTNPIKLSIKEK